MFRKVNFRLSLLSASFAALLFCIPVFFYIQSANYKSSWLLYLGSFAFMTVIWIHTMIDSKQRGNNESTVALIFASEVTTVIGILLTVVLCLLMMLLYVPGYFGSSSTEVVLRDTPANTIKDKTNGLSFELFTAATLINFFVGSFAGVILPFYMKRPQTQDPKEPTPLHHHETK
jgi:hypothetical protein